MDDKIITSKQAAEIGLANGDESVALIGFAPQELGEFSTLIGQNRYLEQLQVRLAWSRTPNMIDQDFSMADIFGPMAQCQTLKSFLFYNCEISAGGMAEILQATQCKSLTCFAGDLGAAVSPGLPALAQAIAESQSLSTIELYGFAGTVDEVVLLYEAVLANLHIVSAIIEPFDRELAVSEKFEEMAARYRMQINARFPLDELLGEDAAFIKNMFFYDQVEHAANLLNEHADIELLTGGHEAQDIITHVLDSCRFYISESELASLMRIAVGAAFSVPEETPEELLGLAVAPLANFKPDGETETLWMLFKQRDFDSVILYLQYRSGEEVYAAEDDTSSVDSEDAPDYVYQAPYYANAQATPLKAAHYNRLSALNEIEKAKKPLSEAMSAEFYLAFSRGVHYLRNRMPTAERRAFRAEKQAGKHILSSAAIDLLGIPVSELATKTPEEQLVAGKAIRKQVQDLDLIRDVAPIATSSTKSPEKHVSARDALQQRYSNGYEPFHKYLRDNIGKEGILFGFTSSKNPLVSCSDDGLHPVKYALGHKAFGGGDIKLTPDYAASGKPKHPYLGKVFLMLMTVGALKKLDPAFVLELHAAFRVTISTYSSNNILPEREVSFPGVVEGEYVQLEMPIRVPNFAAAYKPFYQTKYGLTKAKFDWFKERLSSKPAETLKKLYDHLASHYQEQLKQATYALVQAKNGLLVYRGLKNPFEFEPASVDVAKAMNKKAFEAQQAGPK